MTARPTCTWSISSSVIWPPADAYPPDSVSRFWAQLVQTAGPPRSPAPQHCSGQAESAFESQLLTGRLRQGRRRRYRWLGADLEGPTWKTRCRAARAITDDAASASAAVVRSGTHWGRWKIAQYMYRQMPEQSGGGLLRHLANPPTRIRAPACRTEAVQERSAKPELSVCLLSASALPAKTPAHRCAERYVKAGWPPDRRRGAGLAVGWISSSGGRVSCGERVGQGQRWRSSVGSHCEDVRA